MNQEKIEKDVRFLKIYAAAITTLCVIFLLTAFTVGKNKKFDEIDVKRINVVDDKGKLDMVISGKDHQHPGIAGGKIIERKEKRPAGIIFFNENGDECGGLAFAGKTINGKPEAFGTLNFDQYGQDETLKFQYAEWNGYRRAGIIVQDRSNVVQPEWGKQYAEANKMKDGPEKQAALKPLLAPHRAYFGKTTENTSAVLLNDGEGRKRIEMSVAANGTSKLEFLDENGKVIYSLPEDAKK
jgi:hypothetical protein